MSYSYIKSVFPDFKPSKIYDEKIYQFNVLPQNSASGNSASAPEDPTPMPYNQLGGGKETLESFNNCEEHQGTPIINTTTTGKDNLHFYKPPVPNITHTDKTEPQSSSVLRSTSERTKGLEKFSTAFDCGDVSAHVVSCSKCQGALRKQLGWNSQTEEIMELVSYIVFAVFVYLLIKRLK